MFYNVYFGDLKRGCLPTLRWGGAIRVQCGMYSWQNKVCVTLVNEGAVRSTPQGGLWHSEPSCLICTFLQSSVIDRTTFAKAWLRSYLISLLGGVESFFLYSVLKVRQPSVTSQRALAMTMYDQSPMGPRMEHTDGRCASFFFHIVSNFILPPQSSYFLFLKCDLAVGNVAPFTLAISLTST